ncbi:MAG: TetR/AcrR family transcriptional regulator [Clostridiales bacterium]|nr:TetR/AcrR family transcriptional regulator [Clostridiales bacterium]
MPKVNAEYLEGKKDQILMTALSVCSRKPAYDMTMSDIVAATGMSQGGVYKYFNNIDLVLAALVDKANVLGDYSDRIDKFMRSSDPPEKRLEELFKISELYFSDLLIGYNKLLFELGTLFAYDPERAANINRYVTTASTFGYLIGCASEIIMTQTAKGYFTPVIPAEEILSFIVASFDGIIRDVTLTRCYSSEGAPERNAGFDEKKLIRGLYISTMAMLGKQQ